jgi:hypothetical protein
VLVLFAVPATADGPATITVDPNEAGKGSRVTLDVRPPKANQNPRSLVTRVVRGVRFDPRARAKKCSKSQAKEHNCPEKSRIGGGNVDATIRGGPLGGSKATTEMDLYLAPPQKDGDRAGIVVNFKVQATGAQGYVIGRVKMLKSGPFGLAAIFNGLDTAVPTGGFNVHVDRVRLSFGAKRTVDGKTHHLVKNPKSCDGSWEYEIRIGYPDGSKVPADGSIACTG